jgi:hypothetical protein
MKTASRKREHAMIADLQAVSSPQLEAALGQLLHAQTCARDVHREVWDFAVEIESLLANGLTKSDLRWLVSKGYTEHAQELTHSRDRGRKFHVCLNLAFSKRTCFVLTKAGVLFAAALCPSLSAFPANRPPLDVAAATGASIQVSDTPLWDPQRRELRVGDRIVKQFRVPSPSQEAILAAFSEEGWPPAIDDPLPPQPEQEPKRRLRNTIESLNSNQKNSLLHFRGDGSGQRILWEFSEDRAAHLPAKRRRFVHAA